MVKYGNCTNRILGNQSTSQWAILLNRKFSYVHHLIWMFTRWLELVIFRVKT